MSEAEQVSPDALLALIRSRRSVRHYQSRSVPDAMVQQLLEAGRWAPSAGNHQPWAFIVVRDRGIIAQLAQHAAYFGDRRANLEAAPLLITVCGQAPRQAGRRPAWGEVSMAGMQMMLQAHALGLGTCWVDGLDREAVGAVLQVPEGVEAVSIISVGFPADRPAETTRRPLFDVVHYDTYGSVTIKESGSQ